MRNKIVVAALAGGLSLTGGLLLAPSMATAADDGQAADRSLGGRLGTIKDALKGLVDDKTLTQAQADKVAATLDRELPRRGPRGHRGERAAHLQPAEVAKVLGISVGELRTQLQAGKTLAQIAAAEGMSKSALIAGLVEAVEADLVQAVKAGRLTQAQADAIKTRLTARITEKVDRPGFGPRGGKRHHDVPAEKARDGMTVTPSSTDVSA